jgi:hypothetical protein
VEIASCGPTLEEAMACLPATINVVPPSCAGPDVDCDGFTDVPPAGHDAPANTDIGFDNCIGVANPGQANSDGNFIDMTPPKPADDRTWPRSDGAGDACDEDDDNDGLPDISEPAGCNGSGPLDRTLRDSDGDRALDGVECALGTHPGNPASRPSVADCRAAAGAPSSMTDTDGDRVRDYVEVCFYNTDKAVTNTDGDGCTDGRELGTVDGNSTVNSADLGLVASAFGSYMTPPPAGDAWRVNADLDKNGVVNAADLGLVAAVFGACP